jgi:hypothetical protein
MFMVHVLKDSRNARSKTADRITYDEYQLMDVDLEIEINQILRNSSYGIRLYVGTALDLDSPLESQFNASSGGRWQLACECGKWHDTGDATVCFKLSSKPEGVSCPDCGRILDVRNGFFEHERPHLIESDIGVRVPQIIIPDWANNPDKWIQIWHDINKYDPVKTQQEIFGIPTVSGSREINRVELQAACRLEVVSFEAAQLRWLKNPNMYKFLVSGCDWGGSDHNPVTKTKLSFTVHVILGVRNDGVCELIHAKRYGGNAYRNIATDILQTHVKLNTTFLASDAGVGMFYNTVLREMGLPHERHFIFGYTGDNSRALGLPTEESIHVPNLYRLNKTESLSATFDGLKSVPSRIIMPPWSVSQPFAEDFLNINRVPSDMPGGKTGWRYIRNPRKADDFAQAINFAYTLARIVMGEAVVEDPALRRRFAIPVAGREITRRANGDTLVVG